VYPVHALVDPELTVTLPEKETLYAGLDAISHALESLWNKNRTVISEAFSVKALSLANQALPALSAYAGEMFHPERAGNYDGDLSTRDVERLLMGSEPA